MSLLKTEKMIYNRFGNSGLRISAISFGNMVNHNAENAAVDEAIIKKCLAAGINHFDTAQIYGFGEGEIALGRMLKNIGVARQDIVVATKIHSSEQMDVNSLRTLNKKHVKEATNKSLKRLQLDYVDILYAHFDDLKTPMEQICRAFSDVVEEGKAIYWATSNWNAEHVFLALQICQKLGLNKPIGAQNEYNMLERQENQSEYERLFTHYNYGLIAWSPLAGGFLTGKHLQGIDEKQVSRFTEKGTFPLEMIKKLFYSPYANEKTVSSLLELQKLAEELGCKLVHLAVAWVLKYPHLDSALVGARNQQQLDQILQALPLLEKITPEIEGKINKILGNNPKPKTNWINWTPLSPIRPLAL